MTDILISRLRAMPDNCPNCGKKAFRGDDTFMGWLGAAMEGFYAYPVEVWPGAIQWRAKCESCPGGNKDRMLEALKSESSWFSPVLSELSSRKNWSGGTVAIPIDYGGKRRDK